MRLYLRLLPRCVQNSTTGSSLRRRNSDGTIPAHSTPPICGLYLNRLLPVGDPLPVRYDLARHVSNYGATLLSRVTLTGKTSTALTAEWKPYREAKGQMRAPSVRQLPDSSVTPVTKFMTDYYLSQY